MKTSFDPVIIECVTLSEEEVLVNETSGEYNLDCPTFCQDF